MCEAITNMMKKYWFGIVSTLLIIIAGIFLYKNFAGTPHDPSYAIASVCGGAAIYSLVVFFIANFLRKKWRKKKLEFWIACFAISFSWGSVRYAMKTNQYLHYLNKFDQEFVRLIRGESHLSTNYTTKEYGEFSPLLSILSPSFEVSETIFSELRTASLNLEGILNLTDFYDPEYAKQAKKRVSIFLQALNSCEKRYNEVQAIVGSRIKEVCGGKENLRRYFLRGFEKGKAISNRVVNEYFQVQKESAQKIDEILEFLSERSGEFWESEDELIFNKNEDMLAYNSLVQDLVEYGEKEGLIVQKLRAFDEPLLKKCGNCQ